MNTTGETFMGQTSPSKSGEVKVEENIVTHNVADKCKIGRINQMQLAVNKTCAPSMPNKKHELITTR